jgi:NADPH2:quinone reductase
MKAVVCVEHGQPEALVVRDVATPEPGRGQVRIRVHAAGVNFPDSLIIQNLYQFRPPLPFTPGSEAAGIIDAVGEGVDDLSVGDRVALMTSNGCYAEAVVGNRSQVVPIPADMPFDIASGFTMTYGTSHHALKQRARLQPGETLLVLGAAGGVGLAAVELGKLMGAIVIAAASTEEKLQVCRDYGADETINYATSNLRDEIKRITGGRGADVIYDPVGDRYAEPAFRGIAWNGRYLVVGFAGGEIPSLPLNLPLIKGASIVGVFWGAFTQAEPELHRANMNELLAWYAQGQLKPHISKHFSLDDGPAAIRWMMDRKATGKVVIDVA